MRKMMKEVVRKMIGNMTQNELDKILDAHQKWLKWEEGGTCADLRSVDISNADLGHVNLSGANLCGANLHGANLSHICLCRAKLRHANLSGADLHGILLTSNDLCYADLSGTNLERANLEYSDLRYSNLSDANLVEAKLTGADLKGSNLSGVKGLLSAIDYMKLIFERVDDGYIVYKTFGGQYTPPKNWEIRPGSVLTESVNFDRTDECGCGINVAPLEWVREIYDGEIWRCLIRWEWLPGVCVPYNTDGKIRCERIELLEVVR